MLIIWKVPKNEKQGRQSPESLSRRNYSYGLVSLPGALLCILLILLFVAYY